MGWGVGGWGAGVVCKVIFMSNPTYVELSLSYRCVGVLTIKLNKMIDIRNEDDKMKLDDWKGIIP